MGQRCRSETGLASGLPEGVQRRHIDLAGGAPVQFHHHRAPDPRHDHRIAVGAPPVTGTYARLVGPAYEHRHRGVAQHLVVAKDRRLAQDPVVAGGRAHDGHRRAGHPVYPTDQLLLVARQAVREYKQRVLRCRSRSGRVQGGPGQRHASLVRVCSQSAHRCNRKLTIRGQGCHDHPGTDRDQLPLEDLPGAGRADQRDLAANAAHGCDHLVEWVAHRTEHHQQLRPTCPERCQRHSRRLTCRLAPTRQAAGPDSSLHHRVPSRGSLSSYRQENEVPGWSV